MVCPVSKERLKSADKDGASYEAASFSSRVGIPSDPLLLLVSSCCRRSSTSVGVVLKLVSVEVMVGVVLIRGISLLQLLTDCWLCWMKKLFNIVAFERGVLAFWDWLIRSGIGVQVLVFRHLTTLWRFEWEKLSGWDWERTKAVVVVVVVVVVVAVVRDLVS